MAPSATWLLAALLIAGRAAASGLAQASPSDQCVALLHSLAGHDDLELAALCRARLPQEQCRLAKSALRSQPWAPEAVSLVCAKWDERTRLLQSRGADVDDVDGSVRAKAGADGHPGARARTLEDGVVAEAQTTLDAAVRGKLAHAPGREREREPERKYEREQSRKEMTTAAAAGMTTETPATVAATTTAASTSTETAATVATAKAVVTTSAETTTKDPPATTAAVATTNTDEDRFWRDRRNLLRIEGGRTGINRLPGGEAVLSDMGLEGEQEPEERREQEAAEQKWARTPGLERALASGAAWPFSVLLAFVLMGVVAPLLRTRLARGRDDARGVTAFTPLALIRDEGTPASLQSVIEA